MHARDHDTEGAPSASDPAGYQLAQARALIAAEQEQRMQQCAAELEEVLARYGMRLEVTPAQISLVPKT